MKILNKILLGLLLLTSISLADRFPKDVRYIAGAYTNKTPYFNTLEAALNDVKLYATTPRPYTFWIDCDTVNIPDWTRMRDSIVNTYVTTGKIKFAGFINNASVVTTTIQNDTSSMLTKGSTQVATGVKHWTNFQYFKGGLGYNVIYPSYSTNGSAILRLPFHGHLSGEVHSASPGDIYYDNTYIVYQRNSGFIDSLLNLRLARSWYMPRFDTLNYITKRFETQNLSGIYVIQGNNNINGGYSGIQFGADAYFQLPTFNPILTGYPRIIWGTTSRIYYTKAGNTNDSLFLYSNLINVDKSPKPDLDLTRDFGTPGNRWRRGYFGWMTVGGSGTGGTGGITFITNDDMDSTSMWFDKDIDALRIEKNIVPSDSFKTIGGALSGQQFQSVNTDSLRSPNRLYLDAGIKEGMTLLTMLALNSDTTTFSESDTVITIPSHSFIMLKRAPFPGSPPYEIGLIEKAEGTFTMGDILILKCIDNTTVTLQVNNNLLIGTDFAMGINDIIGLIYDSNNETWTQLFRSDN